MKDVEYLIGSRDVNTIPLRAFDDKTISFCDTFSRAVMKLPESRIYPDIAALAFWCRKSNLTRLAQNYPDADYRLGRGVCFHIAPSNVPINFAFSYFFGLLSGCSNIVRLPSRKFIQVDIVINTLKMLLENSTDIKEHTAFVKYSSESCATEEFSRFADARLIWGGDNTIDSIKALKTKLRCVDICFADRYSFCIIDGSKILTANTAIIARLAESFYNDTYLMDQNACSSPHIIFWQNSSNEARTQFWDAVFNYAKTRYKFDALTAIDKYEHMCADAINHGFIEDVERDANLLYHSQLNSLSGDLTHLRGSCGYFYEYALNNWDALKYFITSKYQTVTYFGIESEKFRSWVLENSLAGIDRIVPVGKAMDISIIWDGYDIIRSLSRYVAIM